MFFWLMKVSSATAVLPVWRSPMISSRWPRPIGTSASSALRPVCTGSWTERRGMMPGALTSTRRRSVVSIGPLPSIGLPSASTTRPRRAFPIGTSTMGPGPLTVEDGAVPLAPRAFGNFGVRAEDHDADIVGLEVQRHAFGAVGELDHFAGL